ncbi:prokineticin Bm8-f-like [Ixodes scapularis]|uniref:prokineticin Bm8-f-like n=1 Tax=Ixodes scapularis TaxID=6945 RepID=UPI001C3911E6|nr:prokineticin Bm8-f-like [Ixodes scapularis]
MKTFCLALALAVIVPALLADVTPEFVAVVALLTPATVPPPVDVCQSCDEDYKCKHGTCCLQSRSGSSYSGICKPLGQRGEECSVAPTEGDIYFGHCPCSRGLRCKKDKRNRYKCVRGN